MNWFKHAFAVDPPGPAEPTEQQQPVVDWVCMQVAKRRLTTPGLIFLEMSRPLNYLGAMGMHVFAPGVWALLRRESYEHYVAFSRYLEQRGSMEYLSRRIEHFEQEFERLERDGGDVRAFIEAHSLKHRPAPPAATPSPGEASGEEADHT